MAASQILATNSLVFPGGGALAVVIGKGRILHAAGRRCQVTDRNLLIGILISNQSTRKNH
jgi:hypothetical protein